MVPFRNRYATTRRASAGCHPLCRNNSSRIASKPGSGNFEPSPAMSDPTAQSLDPPTALELQPQNLSDLPHR